MNTKQDTELKKKILAMIHCNHKTEEITTKISIFKNITYFPML